MSQCQQLNKCNSSFRQWLWHNSEYIYTLCKLKAACGNPEILHHRLSFTYFFVELIS